MSQETHLGWFLSKRPVEPRYILKRLLQEFNPQTPMLASRRQSQHLNVVKTKGPIQSTSFPLQQITVDNAASLYADDAILTLIFPGRCERSKWADIILKVADSIPVQIRGHFLPTEMYIRCGWHDVTTDTETEADEPSFLTVGFRGYGIPPQTAVFCDAFFSNAEICQVRASLGNIVGNISHFFSWLE